METFSALLAICAGNSPAPVNSPYKGQWRGALLFSLICVWINSWVNNRGAGDLKRCRSHYDVNVMLICAWTNGWVNDRSAGDLRIHRGYYDVTVRINNTAAKYSQPIQALCDIKYCLDWAQYTTSWVSIGSNKCFCNTSQNAAVLQNA